MTITTNPSELDNCLLIISHTHTYPDSPRIHVSSVLSSVNRASDALFCFAPRMAPISWEVHDVTRCSPWWITFKTALGTPVFRGALQRRQWPSRLWGLSSSSACAWVCFQDRTCCWVPTGCTFPSQSSISHLVMTPGTTPLTKSRERIIRRPGLTSLHHLYSNCCKSTQGPLNLVKIKVIERQL